MILVLLLACVAILLAASVLAVAIGRTTGATPVVYGVSWMVVEMVTTFALAESLDRREAWRRLWFRVARLLLRAEEG